MTDKITPESVQWTTRSGITIVKKELYDMYFVKNVIKKNICKYYKCSEKIIDKSFKLWGWKFRNCGKLVGDFMKNKSKILPNIESIKNMYLNENKTCKEIGNVYKVCETAIATLLKKNGVILRQLQEAQIKRLIIDKDKIYDLYTKEKLTTEQIAKLYNKSKETIRRILVNYDIVRRSRSENLAKYNIDDLDFILKNNNIIRVTKLKNLSELKNRREKILVKCLNDGHEWKCTVSNLLRGHGCPMCKNKSEKLAYESLIEILSGISIDTQYELFNYVGNDDKSHKAFVDFYILKNNKYIVIEYNGQQHYDIVNWSKNKKTNEERLKFQLFRDNKLRDYCKNNNIILIEIDGRKYNCKNSIKENILIQLKENNVI